ncbi:MAG: 6-phosphofructokinase [Clostridia bacterium]|nr:6-phosphofructokinase [Clostridia bacterium]
MKTIGVLTSGGDAPGMNAAIRAVVRTACENGMKVYGINRGYAGLIEEDIRELNIRSVSDIIHRGGTMLYSARCLEFKEEAGMKKAIETCHKFGIEGIVVIGGDGSFRGARDLSLRGVPCIAIPGTIDNDIVSTDYTIGYDTCLNTIMQMVDRVRDTVESHSRCIVVEVMGNRCGDLTLNAGIAVGATAIVIPEISCDIEKHVIERIKRTQKTDKKHFIVMVAEGIGGVEALARKIEQECGVESRAIVLGHVQRGGSPTVKDRVVASQMGYYAVQKLISGESNRVIVLKNDSITDYDIYEALCMKKSVDDQLYKVAHEISI